jgi:hypothetical protein
MSEDTKTDLINNIKEWIKLDNEIIKMKADIKDKNTKKNKLTDTLVSIMKKNAIDCFDISGGSLVFKQTKVKQTINKKYLLFALQNYYKNDTSKAEEIVEHVLSNREEKIKETIKLKATSN